MRRQGVDVAAAVMPHLSQGFRPRLANARWAAQQQSDVNHVTGDVHYISLSLDPRRTILTIHDCGDLKRLRGWRRAVFKRFWFDLPVRGVCRVTVISEETRRELVRIVPEADEKTLVIPNAVSSMYQPCFREFCSERPVLLHIGSKPNKNVARLAAALEGLPVRLWIVGRLAEHDRQELSRRGIEFTAEEGLHEQQLYQRYCDADIVCFASTYEGFGMPIIEAQWVERPVVTSNCSAMPEVAGDGACLVDPYDPGSIRRGIQRVSKDKAYRRSLLEAGRRNRERFRLERVARMYVDLYGEVAESAKICGYRGAL